VDVGLKGQYNSEWDLLASLRVGLRRILYTSHTAGPPSNFLSPTPSVVTSLPFYFLPIRNCDRIMGVWG